MTLLRTLAGAALVLSIVVHGAAPVAAATISVDFLVLASAPGDPLDPGRIFANGGAGSFEYDDTALTGVGFETAALSAFEVTIFATDPNAPFLPDLLYDLSGAVAISPKAFITNGVATTFTIAVLGSGPESSQLPLAFLPNGMLIPNEVELFFQNEIVAIARYEVPIPEPTGAVLFAGGSLLVARYTRKRRA